MSFKRKFLKHNKLIAWFLILSFIFSLGTSVWSDESEQDDADLGMVENGDGDGDAESETETEAESEAESGVEIPYDIPFREEEELLSQMELVAESDTHSLFVAEKSEYNGYESKFVFYSIYNEDGEILQWKEGMFEDGKVPFFDENGEPIIEEEGENKGKQKKESMGYFSGEKSKKEVTLATHLFFYNEEYENVYVHDENGVLVDYKEGMFGEGEEISVYDAEGSLIASKTMADLITEDDTAYELFYRVIEKVETVREKQEGIFAVQVKENGYIWWSTPINAALDPVAKSVHVDNLSSPIVYREGSPDEYTAMNIRSNTVNETKSTDSPTSYDFINSCEKIEKIDGGARFTYNFEQRDTVIVMDVVLEGDSILVTVPQDKIKENTGNADSTDDKVLLTLSLLNSFGAALSGEDGYVVVPDGSGAVINFDNGKPDSAQYAGQVYGRDYAVSQRLAPPVNQQVCLPVFGIVRDSGNNALVAIAEKGDENAIIRVATPGQGQKVTLEGLKNAIANTTSYNLAWFDFNLRSTDSFYIGTEFTQLQIYETGNIKTGDIAVRYYPIAGKDLSYTDVANTYREYLVDHEGITEKPGVNSLPMYMTLNGGTIKRHSVLGFPVDLQTAATKYSDAEKIVDVLKDSGIDEMNILYNDFSTSSIKSQVATGVKYSSMLGGKKDFKSLTDKVDQYGFSMYPSMGFMEFSKGGGGYSPTVSAPREATRSRAIQQKYELAFGTPDLLQKTSSILSPYYFEGVIDKIVKSLEKEKFKTISLDRATTLLYGDFSRKNQFGSIYYNRRDTVQVLTEGFKKLNDAGISIMAQSANAYALPYVSQIIDVPLHSSNYDVFDYDVPFYQIVLKGLIPYSAKAFNASSNLEELTLLALSTATPIHYEFIYENPGEFNDSEYNKKYYAGFEGWLDNAIEDYTLFKDKIGDVAGKRIISHKRISLYEIETVFEGGKTVYVNLDTAEVKVSEGGKSQ